MLFTSKYIPEIIDGNNIKNDNNRIRGIDLRNKMKKIHTPPQTRKMMAYSNLEEIELTSIDIGEKIRPENNKNSKATFFVIML